MKSTIEDPTNLGVNAASVALNSGDISSTELIEASLTKIEKYGRGLNAFIHVESESSRKDASASDDRRQRGALLSPLDGIPIAIKDNIDIAGQPTTNGLGTRWFPVDDASVISMLRDKGMVFLGKTNMHEAALGATTNNPHYGQCKNPILEGHTPGGSSGGSGAAVSGYLCPAAIGTDTMGSVRVPAAYCGVVGFKPTQNYWKTKGVTPLSVTLDTIGPLARSVRDAAMVAEIPITKRDVKNLKLTVLENFELADMEEDIRLVYEETKTLITRLGVKIGRVELKNYQPSPLRRAGLLISEVEASVMLEGLLSSSPKAFSLELRSMLDYGAKSSAVRYFKAIQKGEELKNEFLKVLSEVKFIISPTTPQTPFLFSNDVPFNQADFTALANFSGCPAVSIPIKHSIGAKPMGLQLMAEPGRDVELLSIALILEEIIGSN